MTTNSLTTCCESTGRSIADSGVAASGQTPVYCPVYESRLLATARHELSSAAALGVYGSPYTGGQGYGNYVTYGTDASAFYSLVSPSSDPSWHWLMEPQGAETSARRTSPLFSCPALQNTCLLPYVIYPQINPSSQLFFSNWKNPSQQGEIGSLSPVRVCLQKNHVY